MAVSLAFQQAAAAQPAASPADRTAIFKAAGFKPRGKGYGRCDDPGMPSYVPGAIEMADLNKDGKPEAWVTEGSTYCYGDTGEAFVLLTKNAQGAWTVILDQVGIAVEKPTKHAGWSDIEVGGPGMGPFPVFAFNGAKYVQRK
jgi:hypothetical protein